MLRYFLLSLAVALAVGYLTVRSQHLHARFTRDVATRRSHKVHRTHSVSRIGGVSIFLGWIAGLGAASYDALLPATAGLWLLCLLPVFVVGLLEDFTQRIPPLIRLCGSFVSAALAYYFLEASLTRVDITGLDDLLGITGLSFALTCFAVAGLAQAINIIDGLNGLASGVCLIALLALGYVSFQVADTEILMMCGLGAGALAGFRVWNFPSGRIFCGDGGAYFLGAYIAVLSVLLVSRHPEVSAWFPLLLMIYPVWETLFSAYRRRVLRGRPASVADQLHMHTLFYKRVKLPLIDGVARTRRNSDASGFMILFASGSAVPAVLWWTDGTLLFSAAMCYIIVYLAIYRRLVRFGQPGDPGNEAYVARGVASRRSSRRAIRETDEVN